MADVTPKRVIRALDRRDSRVCVLTMRTGDRIVPQHRADGMGGSRTKHRLANLLWIDSIANGLIESDATWQTIARAWGVKVSKFVDPERVPVFYRHMHQWFRFVDDEKHPISNADAHAMMRDVYGDQWNHWLRDTLDALATGRY